jgi:hypothetical protein
LRFQIEIDDILHVLQRQFNLDAGVEGRKLTTGGNTYAMPLAAFTNCGGA